jgi:hypothetical protein
LTLRKASGTSGRRRNIAPAPRRPVARRWLGAAAAVVMTSALASCGSISEDTARMIFAAPGKFDDKTCQELESLISSNRSRQKDLEQLMAKSSQAPSGGFVNIIAYRTDYVQGRGDLQLLIKASEGKQCVVDSKYSSGRAVF